MDPGFAGRCMRQDADEEEALMQSSLSNTHPQMAFICFLNFARGASSIIFNHQAVAGADTRGLHALRGFMWLQDTFSTPTKTALAQLMPLSELERLESLFGGLLKRLVQLHGGQRKGVSCVRFRGRERRVLDRKWKRPRRLP